MKKEVCLIIITILIWNFLLGFAGAINENTINISNCQLLDKENAYYFLDKDISSHGITCFSIIAKNITLDGNTHSITRFGQELSGPFLFSDLTKNYGVEIASNDAVVKNITIINYDGGILISEAANSLITINNIKSNIKDAWILILENASNNEIKNNLGLANNCINEDKGSKNNFIENNNFICGEFAVFNPDACKPNLECGEWSACTSTEKASNIIKGEISFGFHEARICRDNNNCTTSDIIEKRACEVKEKLELEKKTIDGKNVLIGRVLPDIGLSGPGAAVVKIDLDDYKKGKFSVSFSQEIDVALSEPSTCANGLQDSGELGVDCGGDCNSCPSDKLIITDATKKFEKKRGSFWIPRNFILAILLISFIILVALLFANIKYNSQMRKEIKEKKDSMEVTALKKEFKLTDKKD